MVCLRVRDYASSFVRIHRIVNFWNSMPEDIVSAPSVNSFKGRFDKHYAHLRYCTEY